MSRIREKVINLWQHHRRGTVTGMIIAILALLAVYLNADWLPELWPTGYRIEKQLSVLQFKQEQLRKALDREEELLRPIQAVRNQDKNFWQSGRDGDPQLGVRQRVEAAARNAGVKLKTLGTLQTSKVIDGINAYEMNIAADAPVDALARMMLEMERMTPRLYWKNLTLNPDNINKPKYLLFSATIKVVAVTAPDLSEQFWKTAKEKP